MGTVQHGLSTCDLEWAPRELGGERMFRPPKYGTSSAPGNAEVLRARVGRPRPDISGPTKSAANRQEVDWLRERIGDLRRLATRIDERPLGLSRLLRRNARSACLGARLHAQNDDGLLLALGSVPEVHHHRSISAQIAAWSEAECSSPVRVG